MNTVTVGCRIPSGLLIQLRDPKNQSVVLQEKALEGSASKAAPYRKELGAGFTEVDSSLWEAWSVWARKNEFPPLVSGAVFAGKDIHEARSMAKEIEAERTLLEGLDTTDGSKDPRMKEFRAAQLGANKE